MNPHPRRSTARHPRASFSAALTVALANSISIHKSQGSQYPAVVVPLLKQHFVTLQRNLLDTAVTRGKRRVIIVGDPIAYAMAVRNTDSRRRCTTLTLRLQQARTR